MCTDKSAEKEYCGSELTSPEKKALRRIFESILESGRAPTIEEMAVSLKKSEKDIIRTLDELEGKDFLLRRKGTHEVISIYPISLTPTEHQIFLEDRRRLFAMCAADALGMPIMFDRNVKIVSQCERCKQEITIEIKNGEIASVSHPNIMICSPKCQEARPAETTCPMVNFFCSKEHLEEWSAEHPDAARNTTQSLIDQAFPRIKECWKSYGEILGIR